ncbi:MAG: hypothetical protein K2M46_10170 [Lachnospiraceae bacterium]|nr:hypothetical protein [Lachnospiraceae bacterium]
MGIAEFYTLLSPLIIIRDNRKFAECAFYCLERKESEQFVEWFYSVLISFFDCIKYEKAVRSRKWNEKKNSYINADDSINIVDWLHWE